MKLENLYICQTTSHILISCALSKADDGILIISSDSFSQTIEDAIKKCFNNRIFTTQGISFYKKEKKQLINVRRRINNTVDSIDDLNSVILFNDVDPISQVITTKLGKKCNAHAMLIEEGIGLYRTILIRNSKLLKVFGKLFFGKEYRYINRIGESNVVTKILCSNKELLVGKQKTKEIAEFPKIDYEILREKCNVNKYYSKYWFVGQPLVEDGVIENDVYIKFIKELISTNSGKFTIKPHPRETLDKYKGLLEKGKVEIVANSDIPFELMIDDTNTTFIYSIYSSALLNFSNRENIKAIYLYKCFDNLQHKQHLNDTMFERNNVIVINSLHELPSVIAR